MKHEIIYVMVRAVVKSDHDQICDTVHEIETQATFSVSNTENVEVLETEVLLTRVRNPKNKQNGTQPEL